MSSELPFVSVIVSTYNRPDALAMVLLALMRQTYGSFEVVIADDGSGDETRLLIEQMRTRTRFALIHAWQEDNGFRAARARNMAVAKSSGDYLIFLDGDCIPFEDFIERHMQLAEEGWLVRGNRLMLSEVHTAEILRDGLALEQFSGLSMLTNRFKGKIRRILPLLRLPYGPFRKIKKNTWQGVKTCNLGMWRKDFVAVNGFDEEYQGWGHEDADLAVRLFRHGVKRKEGVFAVPVLHLWHPMNDRSQLNNNEARLRKILNNNLIVTKLGLSQHIT